MAKNEKSSNGRNFIFASSLDYNAAGMVSRNLSEYMLKHATLSSWKQFYHKPYQTDWGEATEKAVERRLKYGK